MSISLNGFPLTEIEMSIFLIGFPLILWENNESLDAEGQLLDDSDIEDEDMS